MRRKTVSLLLALALLCALAPQLALTANAAASGKCGDNLTWSFDAGSGTLTISGYGEMYAYVNSIEWSGTDEPRFDPDFPWSDYTKQIRQIRFPDGLTNISSYAFYGCSSLQSVNIPKGVFDFCGDVFQNCTSLSEITVDPENVKYTSVYGAVFSKDKTKLIRYPAGKTGEYFVPDGVTSIEYMAFSGCIGLYNVMIPSSVTQIGSSAFEGCINLRSVSMTNSITEIASFLFWNCISLRDLSIPDSVTSIGGHAFGGCRSLESISIPDGLEYIGSDAFSETAYKQNPKNWTNGLLYLGNWLIASDYRITSANIRPGTIGIADEAFFGAENLSSVSIPEGLKYIGAGVFVFCRQFSNISLPGSIQRIGSDAFLYTAIHDDPNRWDHGLLYIGNWLIESEENTIEANVRPGTVGIADDAFRCWESLTTVTLPEGLRFIGESAFNSMYNLRSITFPSSVESIGPRAFSYCSRLKSISIPNRITTISESAFDGCANLNEVRIPDGVSRIGMAAFAGCDSLISVVIPQSVTSIDAWAFGNWDAARKSVLILNKDCAIFDDESTLGTPAKTTIYGYPGSTAEAYAQKYGYTFKSIEDVSFIDVADNVYYTDSVAWAVEREVTNGTAPYLFSPENTCTRAQVVTFLWRAAGSPEPTSNVNPFTDVTANQYYYKAVLWAVEQGITNGVDATHFAPNAGCTRGQVVTFLWRAEGKPEPIAWKNPFADVMEGQYYYKAILWAVENSVTNGTSPATFSPESTCTRAQIVTFLYRDMAEKTDFDNISKDKKVVVGITDFPPMDYQDENGAWTGFDAELARAIFRKLGLVCEFVEIDWDEKISELNNGSIDCVWNGLTLTDEMRSAMECSQPYVKNAQVVVMKRDHPATSGATEEGIANLTFAVEAGSAGEAAAKNREYANVTSLAAQSNALMEVESGTADACIIDLTMANAMTGAGTSYANLTSVLELDKEEYVVGFRKGSDVPAMINKLLDKMKADGSLQALADKYELVLSE